jgi:stage II sporulation protein AA (anti-sigma F factor antagonist)
MDTKKTELLVEEFEKYVILHLIGKFDSYDHKEDIRMIFKQLANDKKNRVLVDFKEVTFFNSTAIGGLLSGRALISKVNGNIVLYNQDQYVDNIFRISRLNLTFPICNTLEEAEKAVFESELE